MVAASVLLQRATTSAACFATVTQQLSPSRRCIRSTPGAAVFVCPLTDGRFISSERRAMETEDGPRRATLYCTCQGCLTRAARKLQRQGLLVEDIAAVLGVSPAAVESLLLDDREAER
jgi:hypothetical protein